MSFFRKTTYHTLAHTHTHTHTQHTPRARARAAWARSLRSLLRVPRAVSPFSLLFHTRFRLPSHKRLLRHHVTPLVRSNSGSLVVSRASLSDQSRLFFRGGTSLKENKLIALFGGAQHKTKTHTQKTCCCVHARTHTRSRCLLRRLCRRRRRHRQLAQLGQQAAQLQPAVDAVADAHVAEADLAQILELQVLP